MAGAKVTRPYEHWREIPVNFVRVPTTLDHHPLPQLVLVYSLRSCDRCP